MKYSTYVHLSAVSHQTSVGSGLICDRSKGEFSILLSFSFEYAQDFLLRKRKSFWAQTLNWLLPKWGVLITLSHILACEFTNKILRGPFLWKFLYDLLLWCCYQYNLIHALFFPPRLPTNSSLFWHVNKFTQPPKRTTSHSRLVLNMQIIMLCALKSGAVSTCRKRQ